MTIEDIKALEELMELWEEGNIDQTNLVEAENLDRVSVSPSPTSPLLSSTSVTFTRKDYKSKSRTFPDLQGNPNIWAFTKQVTQEIGQTKWKDLSQSNLTANQRIALSSLQQNKNIIIKPSDKGGNLVVMDVNQYEHMVLALLQNREWYRKVSPSHVKLTINRYQHLIGTAYHKGLITKKTWEFLNVSSPHTPTMCTLPKIHKNPSTPPERPIVSSNGSLMETTSKLVDDFRM